MQITRFSTTIALCLALAACRGDAPADSPPAAPGSAIPGSVPVNSSRASFLRNVPEVPHSRLIDTTGSEDAQRASYYAPLPLDTVRLFYRRLLPPLGWKMRNEQASRAMYNLYFEKDSATLWIRGTPQGAGTAYTMIGAYTTYAVDTTSRQVRPPQR
jgi:hypothetical protein